MTVADLWLEGVTDVVRNVRHLGRVMGLTDAAIAGCKVVGAPTRRPAEFFLWYLATKGIPRDSDMDS